MSKTNPSVNEKMIELDRMLAWFDGDDFQLEEAVERFAEAQKLAESIEHDLLEMKNKVTVLSERFDQDKE